MKKLLILLLLAGVSACKSTQTTTGDRFILESLVGQSAATISSRYTDANIQNDTGLFEEGTVERPYTTLFPGTPNELQITWNDEDRTNLHDIRFSNSGEWRSSTGVKIGTTYEELVALNGREVSFYGFGWDYSGAVRWNNGKMEDSNLTVFLAPARDPDEKYYGDHIIKASQKEIDHLDLTVQTIIYKS